jgi:Flp pilus assembly protein TadG
MSRRLLAPRRGQNMVEFAIVAIVLMLLTIGVIDFGRAIWTYNSVSFLAREGARYGVIPSRTPGQIEAYVYSRAVLTDFNSTACAGRIPACVVVNRGTCGDPSAPVVVTVTSPFNPVTQMIANLWGGGTLWMKASSEMYVEKGANGVDCGCGGSCS